MTDFPEPGDKPDLLELLEMGASILFQNGCVLSENADMRYFEARYKNGHAMYPKSDDGLKRALEDLLMIIEGEEYCDPNAEE